MSLKEVLDGIPVPDHGVPLSDAGRGSPRIQYALACLLASRPSPVARTAASLKAEEITLGNALRALRPVTELGPDPWFALDPSLRRLHEPNSTTRDAFFRLMQGAGPVVEEGRLEVVPREVDLGDPITITAEVTALPVTVKPPQAPGLDVEFGFGDAYSDFEKWPTWSSLPLFRLGDTHLVFASQWKPEKAGRFWVMARCRTAAGSWSYIDDRGYDIRDPARTGRASPYLVEVVEPKKRNAGKSTAG